MKIAKEFRKLCLPYTDSVYKDGSRNDWVACDTVDMGLYYLLNDDSQRLAHLLDGKGLKTIKFHFPTEYACHEAASAYYNRHGEIYPYAKEWYDSVQDLNNNVLGAEESQVMRFK